MSKPHIKIKRSTGQVARSESQSKSRLDRALKQFDEEQLLKLGSEECIRRNYIGYGKN